MRFYRTQKRVKWTGNKVIISKHFRGILYIICIDLEKDKTQWFGILVLSIFLLHKDLSWGTKLLYVTHRYTRSCMT